MPVLADLIEIGFTIIDPIQPECMDPLEVKRLYGDKITLHGTISCQRTLPFGISSPCMIQHGKAVVTLRTKIDRSALAAAINRSAFPPRIGSTSRCWCQIFIEKVLNFNFYGDNMVEFYEKI